MLPIIFGESRIILLAGIAAAFLCSFLGIRFGMSSLPRDGGRKFAVNGALSKGKPRGAGLIFVAAFTVCGVLFVPFTAENLIYILLVVGGMMSGYLDDASEKPWGEYKKGLIDLVIALAGSFTYVNFNGSTIRIPFTELSVTLPRWLYILLGVVLIWTAINVTNCSDGVDGLSGTLSMITIGSFCLLCLDVSPDFSFLCGIMIAVILAYQWFNASPSILMMGDAGSRAMGLFIAFAAMKSGNPLLYIPLALVTILDGGLGLLKISLKRFLKISILKNTRTPLHDHARKNKGWSDPQTVYRFAIIQTALCFVTLALSL
ncbi:MAG TPA: phospho-N-acetylmuramoyl-pentapeptide-transferase [Candidatus Faecivivens stercoravium]|uniref:Phospho-N-acetylmuramoyl-pentapeptide-transferase n=1 Tax=Candidatus Faecivivens stercoravium TaxID=2840803 RepID=A0A9D1J4B0_9FIRM|nr:phospho-N-acetylmuramoyl-pentapeptide-transferase [Candidatus Faecivivens stercoravium]